MGGILFADSSRHARRMGERILREEGFAVVTVADGETALSRIPDVDPDLVMADVRLPGKSGYEICQYVKNHPKHRHVRVVLLAGTLEPLDEAEAQRVKADAILKKPLEASAVIATVKPLIDAGEAERDGGSKKRPAPARITGSILGLSVPAARPALKPDPEPVRSVLKPLAEKRAARTLEKAEIDPQLVRAAVTIALDRAMPAMIDEITGRVIEALRR